MIMKIKEESIKYRHNLPYNAGLYRITKTEPHYHSKELEIVYCFKGSVQITAGHQNVTVNEGEIFSIDYRDIHYLHSDTDNAVLIFHLDLTCLSISWYNLKYLFFACESAHCYPHQQDALNSVKDIILALSYSLYSYEYPAHEMQKQLKASADRLLDILFRHFNYFNYESYGEYLNIDTYDRFYRILAYCNENYMNKISISQLAEREHINKNYFSQFIRKTVFGSFSSMIKYTRCYEAEHLLLKTDMPVYEISYSCGFSDPKYFYSAFKMWWHCTPTEHRMKYADYMKNEAEISCLSESESSEAIMRYITKWHTEKVLDQ